MAETTQYIVKEGTRWDTVAHLAYGRATLIQPLIENNPLVPVTPRIPAGTVLTIPIIEENEVKTDKERLPPWKQ
jgi:hypothetical protein